VCVVNEGDAPRLENISNASYELVYKICKEIKAISTVDIGVCLLYNDWKRSIDIAGALDLQFVRIDTFIDDVVSNT
jgi:predicted TIM-barrel enzyme